MRQQNWQFERYSRRGLLRIAAGSAAGLMFSGRSVAWGQEQTPPLRDGKRLRVHTAEPLNAEPELPALVENWITPVEAFYVRSHGSTPLVDARTFRLSIEGAVERPREFALEDLRKFPRRTLPATLTCAGNRRSELSQIKPVKGVPWGAGAIGNALWGGIPLAELLKAAGLGESARHVWFESQDAVKKPDDTTFAFGGSIPIERVFARDSGQPAVLLADTMNDQPLPVDHGFPLRALVPGYIGARSVKWLTKIVVSDRPSPNPFVQDVYKVVQTEELPEAHRKNPIYEFPVNAAICRAGVGTTDAGGTVEVAGYALPAGAPASAIERVELSSDGGRSWRQAELLEPAAPCCWRLWKARLPIGPGDTSIDVRAVDSNGATQPQQGDWNAKGYLYNGWHTIAVRRAGT